jgi:hypothetical protein
MQLSDKPLLSFLQYDSTAAHVVRAIRDAVKEVSGVCITCNNLWPSVPQASNQVTLIYRETQRDILQITQLKN